MHITKVNIVNFKCFDGLFTLDLNPNLNILVGDNEAGKSSILEAINLALSGWINGRYLLTELSQSLFNVNVVKNYLNSIKEGNLELPPYILIELYFSIEDPAIENLFKGNKNLSKSNACGVQFTINFNEKYSVEYAELLRHEDEITSIPLEYNEFSWSSFARDDRVTPKTIPIKSALIDSSSNRHVNGSDIYISRIIRDLLTEKQKVNVSQAHRKLKDVFSKEQSIIDINQEI